jgi:hypothetical protein
VLSKTLELSSSVLTCRSEVEIHMRSDLNRLVDGTHLPDDTAFAGVSIHPTLKPSVTAADGANKPQRPDTLKPGLEIDKFPELSPPCVARVDPGLDFTGNFVETGPSRPISAETPIIRTVGSRHLAAEKTTALKHLNQQEDVIRSQPLGVYAENRLGIMDSKAQVAYESISQDNLPIKELISLEGDYLGRKFSDILLHRGRLAEILKAVAAHPALDSRLIHADFGLLLSRYCGDLRWSYTTPYQDQVTFLLGESIGAIMHNSANLLGLDHAQSSSRYIDRLDVIGESEHGSEDEDDVEDAVFAEARTVVRFLIDGIPMNAFRSCLLKCVLQETKIRDVDQDVAPLPSSLPNLVEKKWRWVSSILPEPRLPPGKRRIRWTCVSYAYLKCLGELNMLISFTVMRTATL